MSKAESLKDVLRRKKEQDEKEQEQRKKKEQDEKEASAINKPSPVTSPVKKLSPELQNEGTVRVISFDRIVLSSKWTKRLSLKQGDSLKIKFEDAKLILSK